VDAAKIRGWWSFRQGLNGSLKAATPSKILEQSGWARSVGGAGPYLTLFARGGTSREQADMAVASTEIHELPSARGCTYALPASDFALGLKVGQDFGDAEMKTARKIGVTDKEIDRLCARVITALRNGPLDPDAIRNAVGSAARNLGDAGKKKGITTTLPLALGKLQVSGDIRRIAANGRLDQQRYQYALWRPNPMEKFKLTLEEAYVELARRFFRWTGPATVAEFQSFSGLGVKASKAAIDPLGIVPVEPGSDRLMFPDDLPEFKEFRPPSKPNYALVSSLDAIHAHRTDIKDLLDEKDRSPYTLAQKNMRPGGGSGYLPSHAIFDRGRLVGLWEYDVESQSIAWMTFGLKDKTLDAAVATTEAYIREQLGDARSFSLDSPKGRAPRIEAIRRLRTTGR
jgi:hypothetical protein